MPEPEEVHEPDLWEQWPDEPEDWYYRFEKYYLLQGVSRSIRQAVLSCWRETEPERYEKRKIDTSTSNYWYQMARKWDWEERATAWDQYSLGLMRKRVEQAQRMLMESTVDAVLALQQALTSPRHTVAAAKEILDRGGLPAVSRQEIEQKTVTMSADELAKAKQEAEEWAAKTFGKNG